MAENANAPADEVPFLANEPPPLAARGLAWILLALFVTIVILSAVVHLPETIVSPFVLVPVHGADPVRVPRSGTVLQAFAAEGRTFEKGAPLFAVRSEEFRSRLSEKTALEGQLRGALESATNVRAKNEIDERAAMEDLRSLRLRAMNFERIIPLKRQQLALTVEQADRARKLAEQGIASVDERSNAQIRHSQTVMELEQLESDERVNASVIQRLEEQAAARRSAFREVERTALERAEQLRIRIAGLSGDTAADATGDLLVTAPCEGIVFSMKVRGPGAVVRDGDVLCEMACAGEKLQAELSLPQEGLARIHPGLDVKLLYDAFPYQRFGIKKGVVRWASPAGVRAGDKSNFPVYVQPEEQSILVDGEERPCLAGMRGTARIVIGHRSALSFAFAPLRQLQESVR